MINLLNLEANKVSTDLTQYPMVWMGETGDGKTYSMNKFLTEISPEGKSPLFLMFEDRDRLIQGMMSQRIRKVSELVSIVGQFRNPQVREKFSCVVIDTVDKLESMISRHVATSKEVEIVEDIGFGKGKRYINSGLGLVEELRNLGVTVHFIAQAYSNTDIMTKKTTVQTKLKDVTKAQIFHDAFLVGLIKKESENSEERILTFQKSDTYLELKDSFGLPPVVKFSELKNEIEKTFDKFDKDDLIEEKTIVEFKDEMTFNQVKEKGQQLGGLLAEHGYLEEATNILKTTIGTHDDGSVKMFDSLLETQQDLAEVVVLKLEELVQKHNLI